MNSAVKKISLVISGLIFSVGLLVHAALPPQPLQKVYTDDKLLKNERVRERRESSSMLGS